MLSRSFTPLGPRVPEAAGGADSPRGPGCRRTPAPVLALPLPFLLLLVAGCGLSEVIEDALRGETPHERYGESLARSGLADTHLGRSWAIVAEGALRDPVTITLPHREEGRVLPEEPVAFSWRFELRRGERIDVTFEQLPSDRPDWGAPARAFMELYRVRDPGGTDADPPRPLLVAWTEGEPARSDTLRYEAATSSSYLVRIQPELLAGGSFRVEIRSGASLAFPVDGHSTRHIQSFFGAERDGGRREHHGVDVFAPRGTPVVAAGPGVVRRVRETPVGGRVVWVFDEARNLSRYYAHLDRQLVEDGQRVRPGDTIGTVGNTGNARTTPPHLHFGIYARGEGPVDPLPFLHEPAGSPPGLQVDTARFGGFGLLEDEAVVRVLGGTAGSYRVRAAGSGGDPHRLVPRGALRSLPLDHRLAHRPDPSRPGAGAP